MSLRDRVLAYELVPREANKAKARVVAEMKALGVHHATAWACARAWVKTEDFLLADLPYRELHTHRRQSTVSPLVQASQATISAAYAPTLPEAR